MVSKNRKVIQRRCAEFQFWMLQQFGVWNPYDHGVIFWLYRFYMSIVFVVLSIFYTFLEILDAITVKDDLQLFTENICVTLTHLAGIAKVINLWTRKSKIITIVDILERSVLQQEDEGAIGEMQEKMFEQANWKGKIFTTLFGTLIGLTIVSGMAYPFWDQSYKEWKLPYRCYFPKNTNQSIYYWTSYTFVGVSVIWQAFIILSHDTLFIVFMIHVVAQVTILKSKVETVCNNFSFGDRAEESEDEIGDRDVGSHKVFSRSRIVASESRTNNQSNRNLKSCVKYHQEIIRLVSELESMFSHVILLQFATSLIIIGLAGFQVTVSAGDGRFLSTVGYFVGILIELLSYCWYGNEIIVQSGSLGTAVYACSWYQENKKFCNILKIFMAKTQTPLVVTAGNFCQLSLETFTSILSKSYSYMAILNQLNE